MKGGSCQILAFILEVRESRKEKVRRMKGKHCEAALGWVYLC